MVARITQWVNQLYLSFWFFSFVYSKLRFYTYLSTVQFCRCLGYEWATCKFSQLVTSCSGDDFFMIMFRWWWWWWWYMYICIYYDEVSFCHEKWSLPIRPSCAPEAQSETPARPCDDDDDWWHLFFSSRHTFIFSAKTTYSWNIILWESWSGETRLFPFFGNVFFRIQLGMKKTKIWALKTDCLEKLSHKKRVKSPWYSVKRLRLV